MKAEQVRVEFVDRPVVVLINGEDRDIRDRMNWRFCFFATVAADPNRGILPHRYSFAFRKILKPKEPTRDSTIEALREECAASKFCRAEVFEMDPPMSESMAALCAELREWKRMEDRRLVTASAERKVV